mmetsp:Transcript_11986/g.39742  ORF Transcript_11986/g.39742 Transcript_11986/m.39742 type:complete len:215 (-) Transcript_11986:175-819(-)
MFLRWSARCWSIKARSTTLLHPGPGHLCARGVGAPPPAVGRSRPPLREDAAARPSLAQRRWSCRSPSGRSRCGRRRSRGQSPSAPRPAATLPPCRWRARRCARTSPRWTGTRASLSRGVCRACSRPFSGVSRVCLGYISGISRQVCAALAAGGRDVEADELPELGHAQRAPHGQRHAAGVEPSAQARSPAAGEASVVRVRPVALPAGAAPHLHL